LAVIDDRAADALSPDCSRPLTQRSESADVDPTSTIREPGPQVALDSLLLAACRCAIVEGTVQLLHTVLQRHSVGNAETSAQAIDSHSRRVTRKAVTAEEVGERRPLNSVETCDPDVDRHPRTSLESTRQFGDERFEAGTAEALHRSRRRVVG
jgi:hypothetical protein